MNNVPWYFALLTLTTAQLLAEAANTTELLGTIFLRLYGNSVNEYIDTPLEKASSMLTKMDNNKNTVWYIHGFSESTDRESVKTVATAFLGRHDHNVIAIDYRNISSLQYLQVAQSAPAVGAAIAKALDELKTAGLDTEKVHIIGHSMGAQVASYVGNNTSFQVPQITGLDPAGPLFNLLEDHLSMKNARFVDIIHTDFGFYGIARTTGTVDVFPNGGRRVQPGCPMLTIPLSNEDFCSHHRSWRFYAESVTNENAFIAVKCGSYLKFITGMCNNNEKIPIGYATPVTAKGSFYLVTGSESPFGLKEAGAKA